jgi:hypothetical protein
MPAIVRRTLPFCAAFIACVILGAAIAPAADWKVETRVYEGESTKPSATTTTYFHDGVYYDVLGEPAEVTILDPSAKKLAIIDMNRRAHTEINTDDLARLAERFRTAAAQSRTDPRVRFAAAGEFTTTYDDRTRELSVGGPPLTYRVTCEQPRDAAQAEACREFSDWCARLNSVQPGRMPARARLAVNAAIAKQGAVPSVVRLTLGANDLATATTLRSEHSYTWRLSTDDLVRIAKVKQLKAECKPVSFAEYLGYEAAGIGSQHE